MTFDSLDALYSALCKRSSEWGTGLTEVYNRVDTLIHSSHMSGAGAENTQFYLECIHYNMIIPMLCDLIQLHTNHCLLYVRDYQSNIDRSLHAVIYEDELQSIKNMLHQDVLNSISVDDTVQPILRSISDLIPLSCSGIQTVCNCHENTSIHIERLMDAVIDLEDSHSSLDFSETGELISRLTSFIIERLNDTRTFKTDFVPESIAGSSTFQELYQAYLAVNEKNTQNQDAVTIAQEEENRRIEELQEEYQRQLEEYEKRQTEAIIEKVIITGLCVVASTVVIVGTGGAATPLVVGTVSAVSGAVIAGNNAAASEYVENGWNMKQWDWSGIGGSALLGGVTGFVTGYAGAGISSAITNRVTHSALNILVHSSSTAARIGTNAVVGSISQVISGMGSRGASTFVSTMITSKGDWVTATSQSVDSIFDLKAIAFDAAMGGSIGAYTGYKTKPLAKEYFNEDGSYKWPENNGFEGEPTSVTLEKGTLVDRYGSKRGIYGSPKNVPYENRSLPTGANEREHMIFEVLKPVEVKVGTIAPAFGDPGGGIQYQFATTIQELEKAGVIRIISTTAPIEMNLSLIPAYLRSLMDP